MAVSALIVAIDFAGTVAFGVDHYRVQVTQPEYYTYWAKLQETKESGSITEVEKFLFATVMRTAVGTRQLLMKSVQGFISRKVGV